MSANPFEHLGGVEVQPPAPQGVNPFAHLGAIPVNAGLAQPAAPAVSRMESFGRGASQGATLGFQDEASAGIERLLANLFGDQATKDLYATKSYENLRDTYRQQNADAQKANPWTYLGGQVTGMAPISIATGGSTSAGASGASRFLASLPGQFASGAATSAANAVGESDESDPAKLAEIAAKAGIMGGGTNFGLGLLNKGVGLGLSKAGNLADKFSDSFAIRSLGSRKKYIDQLVGNGKGEELANLLRDEKIVTPFSSHEQIAEKLGSKLDEAGKGIGAIDQQADQFMKDLSLSNPEAAKALQTTGQDFANDVRGGLISKMEGTAGRVGDSKTLDNYLTQEFEQVYGRKPVSLKELREFKGNVREKVNYYGNPVNQNTGAQSAFNDLGSAVENKIEGTLRKIDTEYGDKTMMPTYESLKDRFGLLSQGKNLITDKLARIQANRFLTPSDYFAGGAGLSADWQTHHNPISAIGAAGAGILLNKAGKSYGNQVATTVFDKMGSILTKAPHLLGPYATVLQRAAANGPSDLAVSHYVLQQTDPEYRKKMNELEKEQQP